MPAFIRTARRVGIAALIITYAALVHHVNASGQASMLGALLAVAPVIAISLTLACNPSSRLGGLSLLAGTGIVAWAGWSLIEHHSGFIFWMQDVSLMLILFMTFGRTLLAGRKPLCVYFAEMIHGPLQPSHEHYARRVTWAWVVFFGLMALTSTLLFFFAPLANWSIFVNFLTLPLIALMFMIEYRVRRRVIPDMPPGHILDAVRAYLNTSARTF
ncbi:MAG: hypothetical protein ABI475_01945 [Methylophilaceae bacterium]